MKSRFIVYFCILLSISMFAAADKTIVQESLLGNSINIVFPSRDVFLYDHAAVLHYHVHNSTGYILRNDTTDCTIHVYNETGNHIVEDYMLFDSNDIDFYYTLTPAVINKPEQYGVLIYCNNTKEAGYVKHVISFNANGTLTEMGDYLTILFSILGAICILLYVSHKINLFYFANIPITSHLSTIITAWLITAVLNVGIKINELQLLGLSETLGGIYKAFVYILLFITSLWVLGFLYQVYEYFVNAAGGSKSINTRH